MEDLALAPALLILVAPAVGSFLAVLADRLPRGEDVIRAPSRCRSCQTRIAARDLIPLASFVALRGRCQTCDAAIPPFVFYIELLATGAAVLAVLAGGSLPDMGLAALWLWLLIALGACDLLWMRLPDPLTFALALVAAGTALSLEGIGITNAALGAALGAGSFAILRWGYLKLRHRAGLGLGDVKLMVGLGAFAGPWDLPLLVLNAALLALAAALLTGKGPAKLSATRAIPFGAALSVSAALLWFTRAAF